MGWPIWNDTLFAQSTLDRYPQSFVFTEVRISRKIIHAFVGSNFASCSVWVLGRKPFICLIQISMLFDLCILPCFPGYGLKLSSRDDRLDCIWLNFQGFPVLCLNLQLRVIAMVPRLPSEIELIKPVYWANCFPPLIFLNFLPSVMNR